MDFSLDTCGDLLAYLGYLSEGLPYRERIV